MTRLARPPVLDGLSAAERYEALAGSVTDRQMANGYRELAKAAMESGEAAGAGDSRSASVRTDALDALSVSAGRHRSLAGGLNELAKAGRLGELEADIGRLRKAIAATGACGRVTAGPGGGAAGELLGRAREYERTARTTSGRSMRDGYTALAKQLRDQAGAL